jgi:hypothetical protein
MDIKEEAKPQGLMTQRIAKALEDIEETSKRYPIWIGCTQYLRLDYVQRLLLEILDNEEGGQMKKELGNNKHGGVDSGI